MGKANLHFPFPVRFPVLTDVLHPSLGKQALTTFHLTFQRNQGPGDIPVNIGYFSNHMWKGLQKIGHSTTFIIDNNKIHIMGMVIHRHGKDPGLEQFTFTRSGGTCQKSVRTMCTVPIQNIQTERFSTCHNAKRRRKGLVGFASFPAFENFQLFHDLYPEALQKSNGSRQGSLGFLFL